MYLGTLRYVPLDRLGTCLRSCQVQQQYLARENPKGRKSNAYGPCASQLLLSTTTLSFRRQQHQLHQLHQQYINFAYKPQTIIASYHLVRFSSLTYLLVVFVLSSVLQVFIYFFYDHSPQHSRPLFTLSTKNLLKTPPPHRFLNQTRVAQTFSLYILRKPHKARDTTSE